MATGEVVSWHPLLAHSADVAASAEMLLDQPTWRRRLARLAGRDDLDPTTCQRLSVLAALHDLGKCNLGFQAKGRPELGPWHGHVKEGLAAVCSAKLTSLHMLDAWGDGTFGLLVSAICHHGRPYSSDHPTRFEPALWTVRANLDPMAEVARLVEACRIWFPLAFANDCAGLPDEGRFEHAFAGLVMLADWIGSDQRLFPTAETDDLERIVPARAAARRFASDGWLAIDGQTRFDRAEIPPFTRVAPAAFRPRAAQRAIAQLAPTSGPSVVILEAETGSGKTEAALAHFIRLFSDGLIDGMYFALPTRTAATEIHARVFAAINRAFTSAPPVVLAVPGYLRVDDADGERVLTNFDVLWHDVDSERFRYRAWAGESAKRYLAGCIVVGTIDQVLLSSLRVGHAHLRATALLRQLLVVDEVHASDTYMTRVLESVLARQVSAGGHALLLSATLAAESRTRLLSAGNAMPAPTLAEALASPYPLLSSRSSYEVSERIERDAAEREVSVTTTPWMGDAGAIAHEALQSARRGAHVLIIRNTVSDCVAVQEQLERLAAEEALSPLLFSCRGIAAPHHAHFARPDRETLDIAIKEHFGVSRGVGGCVVTATQTVQQSLDLDADLLLTDLCPIDVLLQRIGRLHRHTRARPLGFETARCVVIVPHDRDLGVLLNDQGRGRHHHGLGSVYQDLRMLETTWMRIELEPQWRIPSMSRQLVEESLHSEALRRVTESGGAQWRSHAQWMEGVERGERRQADLNVVDWDVPYSMVSFPDGERVPTRLGEGDRRVRFHPAITGPFGLAIQELTLPERWVRDVPTAEEYASEVSRRGGVTGFLFGSTPFVYDRYGVRRRAGEVIPGDIDDAT